MRFRLDTSKGRRPSFAEAAEPLYDRFAKTLRDRGARVQTGVFAARMEVALVNDGSVTIVVDL